MTNRFFHFDELTYPEVSALPRDIPLVLPVGHGYNLDAVLQALGNVSTVGLLPALPFGWRGSAIETPHTIFSAMVRNLVNSMREDGFTRVSVLTPSNNLLESDIPRFVLPSSELPAPIPNDTDRQKVVLLPIGHTEQHGHHSPLSTDTIIIDAICAGAQKAAPEACVSLPVYPYGVSMHRRAFAGTFTAGGRAFEDFWGAVLDTLVKRGFTRFYFNSGHGGNCSFLVTVIKYAGERHPAIFAATTWLYLNSPKGIEALQAERASPLGGMGHACELETSLVLALRPELIHLDRAVDELDFISTPSYYMDWIEGGALIANPPWEDDTRTGAYGAGTLGTTEKGQYWLRVAIQEKVEQISEIHEQYTRRRVHAGGNS